MEVTRTNFQEVLNELDDVLKDAAFLGIDGEFTGLNSGPDAGAFDTPAQYYSKLRSGCMDFLLVQFGLSVFTYNKQTNKYSQRSYNFYAFPRPLNRAAPDCRFMCQASSISFLANQGFDFNKLFKLGIPYLTTNEEEKLTKRMEEKQKAREEGLDVVPIPDDDRPQIEEICSRIEEFISSEAEELAVDKCNSFIRRLIHQEARIRWPNKVRVESKVDCAGQNLIIQKAGTKEQEEQREAERRDKEKQEMKQAIGLTALFRKIADSGKLIVGHNMLLDLCHIIHQFFAPLPESYNEFKALVHGLFPRLLDTKVICQSQQFKETIPSSNLQLLLKTLSKKPFSVPDVECVKKRSYSTSTEKSHEAGYDAYITGLCFISLANHLGTLEKPEVSTVLSDSPLLNPFLNKLLIARLKDVPYINLVGKDPNPSRDHVFHITFPKDWRHNDLHQLFSPFGGVYVSWLSNTTAYVGLYRRDQASAVMKNLKKTNLYEIQKYSEHQASLEVNNRGTGEHKRKLSQSEGGEEKKEGKSMSANGEKESQENNGWEIATGNDPRLWSEPTNLNPYPQDRSAASVRQRGTDNEVVHTLCDQIKGVQKVRLKNTVSLPTDFRNRKKGTPKYTILRRGTDTDLKLTGNEATNPTNVRKPNDTSTEKIMATQNFRDHLTSVENENKSPRRVEMKKDMPVRSKHSPTLTERTSKSNHASSIKSKQIESSPKKGQSSRGSIKTVSSTSDSPKKSRTRPTDWRIDKEEKVQAWCGEYLNKHGVTREETRKASTAGKKDQVVLRKPTMALLRSAKNRSENDSAGMSNLIVSGAMMALVAGFFTVFYMYIVHDPLQSGRIR